MYPCKIAYQDFPLDVYTVGYEFKKCLGPQEGEGEGGCPCSSYMIRLLCANCLFADFGCLFSCCVLLSTGSILVDVIVCESMASAALSARACAVAVRLD